jgi:nucleoside-diphosphate-sugar epimerase
MAGSRRPTVFVTGAAGFLGTELVKVLVSRGCAVIGMARSAASLQRLRHAGAIAVRGDLLVPGQWQDEAGADWVFHLPPRAPAPDRRSRRDARIGAIMDMHLLDAIAAGATRRIVYVADARLYGPTASRPITEDERPASSAIDRRVDSPLNRIDGYLFAGLPIVTALPGCVYGNGSWFRESVIDPVLAGRRIVQSGSAGAWVSPIHVHDCARALVHLAEHAAVGRRYFLATDEPVRRHELAQAFARQANRPLRVWRVPAVAARLFGGLGPADDVRHDLAVSNIRLRATGFRFRYPTLEQGFRQILGGSHG